MSYDFAASGAKFAGDFGSNQANPPLWVACRVKYADHPLSSRKAVVLSRDITTNAGTYGIATNTSDGTFRFFRAPDAGGETGTMSIAPAPATGYDAAWVPVMGVADGATPTGWDIYWDNPLSSNASADADATITTRYITIGGFRYTTAEQADFKIAEVCFGFTVPTAQQREDWADGVNPLDIWDGQADWYYYPLDTENTTQADQSGNGGPSLTAVGSPAYDADHPTISPVASNVALSLQPLYYGATLLANKTNIQWLVTEGHSTLTGTWRGAGVAGTTDASGNFTPDGSPSLGTASDEVTLHLYWEEGSEPVVDRSLIVKTTLVADT